MKLLGYLAICLSVVGTVACKDRTFPAYPVTKATSFQLEGAWLQVEHKEGEDLKQADVDGYISHTITICSFDGKKMECSSKHRGASDAAVSSSHAYTVDKGLITLENGIVFNATLQGDTLKLVNDVVELTYKRITAEKKQKTETPSETPKPKEEVFEESLSALEGKKLKLKSSPSCEVEFKRSDLEKVSLKFNSSCKESADLSLPEEYNCSAELASCSSQDEKHTFVVDGKTVIIKGFEGHPQDLILAVP